MRLKPLEAFLISIHPEAVERGVVLLTGQEIEFGTVNRRKVHRLIREHYANGQETLKNFNQWLVRSHGLKQPQANMMTAVVWNVLCMTFDPETRKSNPLALIDRNDETYSYGTKMQISHALHHWARYSKDSQLYEKLVIWMRRGGKNTPQYVLEQLESAPPYTRAEYRRLLKALEEFKGSPRYPWAWPCLRLAFTQGVPLTEIPYLKRIEITQALEHTEGLLKIGRTRRRRAVLITLIEQELRYLLSFPFEWNLVGDIIDPIKAVSAKTVYSITALKRVVKLIFARAKVPLTCNWYARMRWSAAWQYYQKTGNLVGAAQILGFKNMKVVAAFLDELKKRAAAAAAQKEKEDETVDVEATCEGVLPG